MHKSAFRIVSALCLLATFFSASAFATEPPPPTVAKILCGDAFVLNDGHTVRLEGIHAPFAATASLADQATAALEKALAGKTPVLKNISTDRYGNLAAQVFIPGDGGKTIRLQEELLSAGVAFVYPPAGSEAGLDAMLHAEAEARSAKRGIWADAAYADTQATEAGKKTGQFAFVNGTVVKAGRFKNKIYLDFGEDWRRDFTVTIAAHDLHNFRKANIDPLGYEGKTLRIRGWIDRDPGPMMSVTNPAQVEVMENH